MPPGLQAYFTRSSTHLMLKTRGNGPLNTPKTRETEQSWRNRRVSLNKARFSRPELSQRDSYSRHFVCFAGNPFPALGFRPFVSLSADGWHAFQGAVPERDDRPEGIIKSSLNSC
jgi:hypothetical protein